MKGVRVGSALAFIVVMIAASSTLPSGSPSPSAAPVSATASASATAAREPLLESLEAQSIPTSASKAPTVDEWKTATPIEFTRRSLAGRWCRAHRLREWLKVDCPSSFAGIRQVGGNPDGVYLWIYPMDVGGAQVVMSMRPGDRRVLQFYDISTNEQLGPLSGPGMILDEAWIEGEKSPTLVLR